MSKTTTKGSGKKMKSETGSGNVYADLSSYLINYKTPAKISDADGLVSDMVEFIMATQKMANPITKNILSSDADTKETDPKDIPK